MHQLWKNLKFNLIKIMEKNIEYKVFPYHFFMLTTSAICYPKTVSASTKKIFKIMKIFFMFAAFSVNIQAQIFVFQTLMAVDAIACSSLFSGAYKAIRLSQQRNKIVSILDMFVNDKAEVKEIEDIRRKFDKEIRYKIMEKDDYTNSNTFLYLT